MQMNYLKDGNNLKTNKMKKVLKKDKVKEFEYLSRQIMKFLCENYHPHVTVIITPTNAELLEGKIITSEITDYVID
jgi:hypothetical protein